MANDTAQPTSCPAKPVPAPKVLELPPHPPTNPPSERFDEPPMGCSTQYASILYSTEQQEFWLLPKRAAGLVKEAIHILDGQIAANKPADERKKGLDQCGLLDYFLEPHLGNFLDDQDKARLEQIERDEPYIEDPSLAMRMKDAARRANAPAASEPLDDRAQATHQQEQWRAQQEAHQAMLKLNHEWQQLRKKAVSVAKEQGYTYEAGSLFQPEAIEARARVQDYLEKREAVLTRAIDSISDDAIARHLAEDKQQFEQAIDCRIECEAQILTYFAWRLTKRDKQAFAEYRDAIIKVADYGLALPEFALLPAKDASVISGIDKFKEYLALEKQQRDLTEAIRKKYQDWIEATGQSTPAPAGLVDQERADWETLQQKKKAMQLLAEANVAQSFPRRHLLWTPHEFQPKPVERLVKADFPLREISMLETPNKPLSYFSLLNLDDVGGQLKRSFKQSIKDAREQQSAIPENGDGKASTDAATSVFHEWLRREGATRIRDQAGDWFDAEGWFDVELFNDYLLSKHYQVEVLADPASRKEWGKRLQQVIFKDSIRRQLRLFDNRPQAQLVRCLTPAQPTIHSGASLTGPNFSLSKGFASSVEVTLDVDLARGEVELFKLDLPPRERATPLKLKYLNYRGEVTELNLGRFSLHLGARAWGYTGASLLLAGELALSHANSRYRNPLLPDEQAKRAAPPPEPAAEQKTYKKEKKLESAPLVKGAGSNLEIDKGAGAKFHLFAGTQAGLKLTGALNWAPPQDGFSPPQTISQKDALNAASSWLSLARLTGELGGALGVGIAGEFNLSLQGGRLVIALKATAIAGPGVTGSYKFEVGYEAIFEIHNLFRRELHKNNYYPLGWVEPEASDFLSKICLLGAMGLNPAMIYLMAYDKVMTLYEAVFKAGRGGSVAYTIMNYPKQLELKEWLKNAPPQAVGPLLYTLTFPPESFSPPESMANKNLKKEYNKTECHHLQQQAIGRITAWLAGEAESAPQHKIQFIESCKRMNKFGSIAPEERNSYCRNRSLLDAFMREPVNRILDPQSDTVRNKYLDQANFLGAEADTACRTIQLQQAGTKTEPYFTFGH